MRTVLMLVVFVFALASCGVDGKPLTPTTTAQTTVGFNSSTGTFSRTSIGVEFGG